MTRDKNRQVHLILNADWLGRLGASGAEWPRSYLGRLLARADHAALPAQATVGWSGLLAQLWQQPLPGWSAAAFALVGEGGEAPVATAMDEPARWWRADPVHLVAGLDHLRLAAAGPALALDGDQASALVALLHAHLAQVGLALFAPSPIRWYLRADRPWQASSVATAFAAGRDLRQLLATGPQATAMLGLVTECQMLLAQAPTNRARADLGLPPVNSLWLWGGGVVPAALPPPWAAGLPALVSTDPELRGAWAYAGRKALDAQLPAGAVDERRGHVERGARAGGNALIVLDHDTLARSESPAHSLAWLDSLLDVLMRQAATRVHLVVGASCWQLPTGLRAQRWWPFARHAVALDVLLAGGDRGRAHPWYSRGLRPPPAP